MILATTESLSSRKEPTTATARPFRVRCPTIPAVTSAEYGVTTPILAAPRAPMAATAAAIGLVFGTSGWARRIAASTPSSPINVAAEVQP